MSFPTELEALVKIKIRQANFKKKKLCPRCLKEVNLVPSNLAGILPTEYLCNSCGYQGSVVLENEN